MSGKLIFNNACRTCHTITQKADNRLGPHLEKISAGKPVAAELWLFQCDEECRLPVWDEKQS